MATITNLKWINTSINIGEQVIYRRFDNGDLLPIDSVAPNILTYSDNITDIDPYPYLAEYVVSSKVSFGEHGDVELLSEPLSLTTPPRAPTVETASLSHGIHANLPTTDLLAGLDYTLTLECSRPYANYQPDALNVIINNEVVEGTVVTVLNESDEDNLVLRIDNIRVDVDKQVPTHLYDIQLTHYGLDFFAMQGITFKPTALVHFRAMSADLWVESPVIFLDANKVAIDDYYTNPPNATRRLAPAFTTVDNYALVTAPTTSFRLFGPGITDVISMRGSLPIFSNFRFISTSYGSAYQSVNMTGVLTLPSIPTWVTSLEWAFAYTNITAVRFNITNSVTNLSYVFYTASKFNGDLSGWDVSSVTTLRYAFSAATEYTGIGLDTWDTSNVTNMSVTFSEITNTTPGAFSQISNWNTSKVTTMESMFADNYSDMQVSNWDVSSVTTMENMFQYAVNFTGDLSRWNTVNVTSMASMFKGCTRFNGNVGNFNTSKVTLMSNMFWECPAFNQNISNWDVSKVVYMSGMFYGCKAFNQPLNNWNTTSLTRADQMFSGCSVFNQPLSNWDMSKVVTINNMFYRAVKFNGDITTWDTGAIKYGDGAFSYCDSFDQDISGWNTASFTSMPTMFNKALMFSADLSRWCIPLITTAPSNFAKDTLLTEAKLPVWGTCYYKQNVPNTFGFIADAGSLVLEGNTQFTVDRAELYDVYINGVAVKSGSQLLVTAANSKVSVTVKSSTQTILSFKGVKEWVTYPKTSAINNLQIGSAKLTTVPSKLPPYITTLASMFEGSTIFNSPNVVGWDVSRITSLYRTFYKCSAFNQPIGVWNISNVNTLSYALYNCPVFNQPLTNWNTSKVIEMDSTFAYASSFNQYIGNWDVSKVTSMVAFLADAVEYDQPLDLWATTSLQHLTSMFRNALLFNQPLGHLNMSSAVNMTGMFEGAIKFNQNINDWDVRKVMAFQAMFRNAVVFNQPLNKWTFGTITTMQSMFNGATEFDQDISGWCMTNVTTEPDNFSTASKLTEDHKPVWGTCPFKGLTDTTTFLFETRGVSPITISTSTNDVVMCRLVTSDTYVPISEMPNYSVSVYNGNPLYTFKPGSAAYVTVKPIDVTSTLEALTYQDQSMVRVNHWATDNKWVKSVRFTFPDTALAITGARGIVALPKLPSYITSTKYMFQGITDFNLDISTWVMSNVTDTSFMFNGANAFNQSLNAWDVSSVTTMESMFAGTNFNKSLADWNTSKVKTFKSMFKNTPIFNQSLSTWDFRSATTLESMFEGALLFNSSFGTPNFTSVTTMARMFAGAVEFNQPINGWDVSNVVDYTSMFESATKFNQDLSAWSVRNGRQMVKMFYNATVFSKSLILWDVEFITTRPDNFANGSSLPTAIEPVWGLVMGEETQLWYELSFDQGIAIVTVSNGNRIDWGDGTVTSILETPNEQTYTHNYTASTAVIKISMREDTDVYIADFYNGSAKVIKWPSILVKRIALGGSISGLPTDHSPKLKSMETMFHGVYGEIPNLRNWDTSTVTSMRGTFENCDSVPEGIGYWDVSNVTTMENMFRATYKWTGTDLSQWNTAKVTNMAGMFYWAEQYNHPLNAWDVSNVTDMSNMFNGASMFNQDLSSWDVGKVTDFERMFEGAFAFNKPINSWNMSSAKNISYMFTNARSFNQELYLWDVSSVTTMAGLFYGTLAFNRDISMWNVSKVTNMTYMFYGATAFTHDLSLWCVPLVTTLPASFTSRTWSADRLPVWGTCPLSQTYRQDMVVEWADSGTADVTIVSRIAGLTVRNPDGTALTAKSTTNTSGYYTYVFSGIGNGKKIISVPDTTDTSVYIKFTVRTPTKLHRWPGPNKKVYHVAFTVASGTGGTTQVPQSIPPYITSLAGFLSGQTTFNQDLSGWDVSNVTDMSTAFQTCTIFNKPLNTWNTANVTDMYAMFSGCSAFNQPLNNWNVSKVTNMTMMFYNCSAFNGNVTTWNTASLVSFFYIFSGCTAFNQNVNSWNVSKVSLFSGVFTSCVAFNQPLDKWDMSSATSLDSMFYKCTVFNQDLSTWNIANVDTLSYTFYLCTAFEKSVNAWNTSNVTNMSYTFYGCSKFNHPLNNWDVRKVTTLYCCFQNCSIFNQDLSMWNTAALTNTMFAFSGLPLYNYPMNGWDVSKVTNMSYMFQYTPKFNQPLFLWDVGAVTNMNSMFYGATAFTQDLSLWCVQGVVSTPTTFNTSSALTAAQLPVWGTCPLRSIKPTDMVLGLTASSTSITMTLPVGTTVTTLAGDSWSITQTTDATSNYATYTLSGAAALYLRVRFPTAITPASQFKVSSSVVATVLKWPTDATVRIARYCFENCTSLTAVPSNLPTSVTSTLNMFKGCSKLNCDISQWDVSNVTTMESMFEGATLFNHPLNKWVTSKVTSMASMFKNATAFNQSLDRWVMTVVTTTASMFEGASSFNSNVSTWNFLVNTNLSSMFKNAVKFNQVVDTWYTASVTTIASVFEGAIAFNQPVANWNVAKVTNMSSAFKNASAFNQLFLGWNTSLVTDMSSMFEGAASLIGGVNNWNVSKVTNMSSMFKGCDSLSWSFSGWDTSAVLRMDYMFASVRVIDTDVTQLNTSKVYTMEYMFYGSALFNQDISIWKVSNVTNMNNMLDGCRTFAQDLSYWCVENVLTAPTRFNTNTLMTTAQTPVWGTCPIRQVFGVNDLVFETTSAAPITLVLDAADEVAYRNSDETVNIAPNSLSGYTMNSVDGVKTITFTASKVGYVIVTPTTTPSSSSNTLTYEDPSMVGIIQYPARTPWFKSLKFQRGTGQITRPNFKKLPGLPTYLSILDYMFEGITTAIPDISGWNTVNVISCVGTFKNCTTYNQNINNWDVSNVINMSSMFEGCTTYNRPLYDWDVSKVNDMTRMFYNASSFKQDLFDWCVAKIYSMSTDFGTGAIIPNGSYPIWGTCPAKQTWAPTDLVFETRGGPEEIYIYSGDADVVTVIDHDTKVQTIIPVDSYQSDEFYRMRTFVVLARSYVVITPLTPTNRSPDVEMCYEDKNIIGVLQWPKVTPWFKEFSFSDSRYPVRQYFTKLVPLPPYITSTKYMFFCITSTLPNITHWDMSNVTVMEGMFAQCTTFNQDISGWNVSKVKNMNSTFQGCTVFNQPIGKWNVPALRILTGTFEDCKNFNQSLNGWALDSARHMDRLFKGCTAFNQPLDLWSIESVYSATSMFHGCTAFNQPLGHWNPSGASNLDQMFYNATNFSQDLSKWCVPFITKTPNNFHTGSALTTAQLPVWGTCPRVGSVKNEFVLRTTGSASALGYVSHTPVYLRDMRDNSLTLGTSELHELNSVYGFGYLPATTGLVSIIYQPIPEYLDDDNARIFGLVYSTTVKEIVAWPEIDIGIRAYGFLENTQLTTVPRTFPKYLTRAVEMFYGCPRFNSNVNDWDMSNITSIAGIFDGCTAFNQPLDRWDVSNVTNMASAFKNCQGFNQDLSVWDTSNVTDMSSMFDGCPVYNYPMNRWNVSNVTSMVNMFRYCNKFNQPLYRWDVSKVNDMARMFWSATTFNQDLSMWCVSRILWDDSSVFGGSPILANYMPVWGTCPIANFTIVDESNIAYIGEERRLTARVATAGFIIDSVVWESSNPSAISITSDGVVMGIGTGSAKITAIANDRYVAYYDMISRIRKAVTPVNDTVVEGYSVYRGVNLYDFYTQVRGIAPQANTDIVLVVPPNVALVGSTTVKAGITVDSRMNNVKSITIINYGFISGIGSSGQPNATGAGVGIANTSTKTVNVWNTGLLTGGGGGGGTSYASYDGGGGGAPFGAAGVNYSAGTAGGLFIPGKHGTYYNYNSVMMGGDGGAPGYAGVTGDTRWSPPADRYGTAAGATFSGSVVITNYNGAIRRGSDGTFTGADPLPEETSDITF